MSRYLYSMALVALLCATPVWGQDDQQAAAGDQSGVTSAALSAIYGIGVHAYFSGDAAQAEAVLTSAIEAGTPDARAYYFRGLARLQQGNKEGAAADFAKGAEVENMPSQSPVNIDQALMRVQGAPRIQIEGLRAAAREAAQKKAEAEQAERFNKIRENESRVRSEGNPFKRTFGEKRDDAQSDQGNGGGQSSGDQNGGGA